MTAREAAQGTVESMTDLDFTDLPDHLQHELIDWWARLLAWRDQRDIVIEGEHQHRWTRDAYGPPNALLCITCRDRATCPCQPGTPAHTHGQGAYQP